MKKIYNNPTIKILEISSSTSISISTGLTNNINWNEIEKDNWSDLFGDFN